jgi:hypothetical protein
MRPILLLLALLSLPLPLAAQQITPQVPGSGPRIVSTVTPGPEDARLTICSAPQQPGFQPHIVRPGERLADLLTGIPNITVTQLAALNCLDDPAALPVGAVVWIPARPAEAVPVGEGAAQIDSFTVDALAVQNQGSITFAWETSGTRAYFYACPGDPNSACRRPATASPVALVGELTLSDFQYAGLKRFRLEVEGGGETVSQDITIEVTCSQPWLGSISGFSACPAEPARAVFAAWQPFAGGVMLWFSDTQEIWVLTNADHRVQVFADTFTEGEPDPAFAAPEDRYTPTRGFGKVWEVLGGPDSPLGWALAPETGFDSARQPAGTRSFTTYIQGPGATVYAVTRIPSLAVGLWTQVAG